MQAQTKVPHLDRLPLSRDERIAALLNHIISTIHQPMSPAAFCQKWVKHPLTQQNYSRTCDRVLSEATGLSAWGFSSWGKGYSKYPAYIGYVLRLADIIREAQALGICRSSMAHTGRSEQGRMIPLPNGYPKPTFELDEAVTTDGEFGTVAGFVYLNEWHYLVKLHPDSPQAKERKLLQVPQSKLNRW